MHKHDQEMTSKVMEKMEKMFLNSDDGESYRTEYEQLENQMNALEMRRYEFWDKLKAEFMEYLEEM